MAKQRKKKPAKKKARKTTVKPAVPPSKQWYSLVEAAALLGIEPQTLGYHIAKLHIPATKIANVWLLYVGDLMQFAGKRRKAGRPPKAKEAPPQPSPGSASDPTLRG